MVDTTKVKGIGASVISVFKQVKTAWSIPKGRKQLIAYMVICVLSFLPIILTAIVFAVSTSTPAARTAIYLFTLAFALVSIAYSTYLTRKRILRVLAKNKSLIPMQNRPQQQNQAPQSVPVHPTHRVDSAINAFNSEQRIYEQRENVSPTLASQSNLNYPMPQPSHANFLPYEALPTEAQADSRTNGLYMMPMVMPVPHNEQLQVRNQVSPNHQQPPRMNMPTAPTGTHPRNIPMVPLPLPPAPAQLNSSGATLPEIPTFQPIHISQSQFTTDSRAVPAAPSLPPNIASRTAEPVASVYNAVPAANTKNVNQAHQSVSLNFGPESDNESGDESDDESVKLYSFDMVKVRSDNIQEEQSHQASSSSSNNRRKHHDSFNTSSAIPSTSNINPLRQSQTNGEVHSHRAQIIPADQLSSTQSSLIGLPSHGDAQATATKTSKEKSKLRLSAFPPVSPEDGFIERWLQSSVQPEVPNPILHRIGQRKEATNSVASSVPDLIIPDKFSQPEGSKIVKSAAAPTITHKAQNEGMSIYGERGIMHLVDANEHSESVPDLPSDSGKLKPLDPSDVAAGISMDLMNLDEPILDSTDLTLRRPTLIDYQKKADAKRKMLKELDQVSERSESETHYEQQQQHEHEQQQPSNAAIAADASHYFSAVSLPQTHNHIAAAAAPVPPTIALREINEENNEEDFLDSDSEDEAPGSMPQATTRLAPAEDNHSVWRPASINFDSLAAQLAKAIASSDGGHTSINSTNAAGLRESVMIHPKIQRSEHVSASPSQMTTMFSRQQIGEHHRAAELAGRPSNSSESSDGDEYDISMEAPKMVQRQ
ncbi:hypothetical protein LPJ66_003903 [Kickxella alabastrina]|uniref:Uncharacterized protein n=1 Tax=Kickxella alabastrina TaxID=61397 RepID=A0ACC1IL56_9FUNG|nr:hypothetical protein LPJ66_003903 [Kickxella alabastrina]